MAQEVTPYNSSSTVPAKKRYQVAPNGRKVAILSLIAAAPLLERLTPMAYNTSTNQWLPWDNTVSANGLGIISGFLVSGDEDGDQGENVVQISATEETHGVIMIAGELHVDDLPLYLTNTLSQIKTAINASGLSGRMTFQGMDNDAWVPNA